MNLCCSRMRDDRFVELAKKGTRRSSVYDSNSMSFAIGPELDSELNHAAGNTGVLKQNITVRSGSQTKVCTRGNVILRSYAHHGRICRAGRFYGCDRPAFTVGC